MYPTAVWSKEMAELARAAGTKLVLVEYPLDFGLFAAANRAMRRVGEEHGVPTVDSPVAQARVPLEQRKYLWAGHPNGAIYREIARDAAARVHDARDSSPSGSQRRRVVLTSP